MGGDGAGWLRDLPFGQDTEHWGLLKGRGPRTLRWVIDLIEVPWHFPFSGYLRMSPLLLSGESDELFHQL